MLHLRNIEKEYEGFLLSRITLVLLRVFAVYTFLTTKGTMNTKKGSTIALYN